MEDSGDDSDTEDELELPVATQDSEEINKNWEDDLKEGSFFCSPCSEKVMFGQRDVFRPVYKSDPVEFP